MYQIFVKRQVLVRTERDLETAKLWARHFSDRYCGVEIKDRKKNLINF